MLVPVGVPVPVVLVPVVVPVPVVLVPVVVPVPAVPVVVVPVDVVDEVAVPPVPLAIFGWSPTGMVPCARPLVEVAVATVVAAPT